MPDLVSKFETEIIVLTLKLRETTAKTITNPNVEDVDKYQDESNIFILDKTLGVGKNTIFQTVKPRLEAVSLEVLP